MIRFPALVARLVCFSLFSFALAEAAPTTKVATPLSDVQLGFPGNNRTEVLQHCKRVGVVPMPKPLLPGVSPDASGRIEAAAASALRDAGIELGDSADYTKAFDSFNRSMGGIYNQMTGIAKQGAYSTVVTNALREYFEKQHLDCIAWLSTSRSNINVLGKTVFWDGAEERVNGQPPPGGLSDLIFANGEMHGALPALSLQLQLLDRANKVLFGRRGGVQLLAYHDPSHGAGNVTFLHVPRAQLLLDDQRIARALRNATQPLKYSPEQIAAGENDPAINTLKIKLQDLPPVPAGVISDQDGLKVPREQLLSTVHRVALGPLFTGDFKVAPELIARYGVWVHEELKHLGWEVVDAANLNSIATAALIKSGGFYDPMTGMADPAKVADMMRAVVSGLAMTPPPDAILTINLQKTQATQKWATAEWDGAEQDALTLGLVTKGPRLFGGSSNAAAGEGSIGASSVRVLLRNPSNVTLYDAAGGIELLQQLSLNGVRSFRTITYNQKLTDRAPQELFQDEARNQRSVHLALRELSMSAAEIAAENQPVKPKAH